MKINETNILLKIDSYVKVDLQVNGTNDLAKK